MAANASVLLVAVPPTQDTDPPMLVSLMEKELYWANEVYELKSIGKVHTRKMGCWKDTSRRAIPALEKLDVNLDGEYSKRKDAISKCVAAAFDRGYTMIAVQNGGWCAGARNAELTYKRYGSSRSCRSDGEVGPWANEVYQLDYEWIKNYE